MKLPPGITTAANPMPDRSVTVLRDGAIIGKYHHRHSGGGYRWNSTVVDKAYGDAATAHLAIVAIVEMSRDRSASVAEGSASMEKP